MPPHTRGKQCFSNLIPQIAASQLVTLRVRNLPSTTLKPTMPSQINTMMSRLTPLIWGRRKINMNRGGWRHMSADRLPIKAWTFSRSVWRAETLRKSPATSPGSSNLQSQSGSNSSTLWVKTLPTSKVIFRATTWFNRWTDEINRGADLGTIWLSMLFQTCQYPTRLQKARWQAYQWTAHLTRMDGRY